MSTLAKFLELESDPGIFSLILKDLQMPTLQVEEVYDLDSTFRNKVLGFIFLFKWGNFNTLVGSARRKAMMIEHTLQEKYIYKDPNANTSVFDDLLFIRQRATNSCATHALLSILLNSPDIEKSAILAQLRSTLAELDRLYPSQTPPQQKLLATKRGELISQNKMIQKIHNKYGSAYAEFEEEDFRNDDSEELESEASHDLNNNNPPDRHITSQPAGSSTISSSSGGNASNGFVRQNPDLSPHSSDFDNAKFHFTCYVPYSDHLVELDGLRDAAILHSEQTTADNGSWAREAQNVIKARIKEAVELDSGHHDIRYSLLAVTKQRNSNQLKSRYTEIQGSLDQLISQLEKQLSQKRASQLSSEIRKTISDVKQTYLNQPIGNSPSNSSHIPSSNTQPPSTFAPPLPSIHALHQQMKKLAEEAKRTRLELLDQEDRFKSYDTDQARRTHDYFPFIQKALQALDVHNLLPPTHQPLKANGQRSRTTSRSGNESQHNPADANNNATDTTAVGSSNMINS